MFSSRCNIIIRQLNTEGFGKSSTQYSFLKQKARLEMYQRKFLVHLRESDLPDPMSRLCQYSTSGAFDEDGKKPCAMEYLAKYIYLYHCVTQDSEVTNSLKVVGRRLSGVPQGWEFRESESETEVSEEVWVLRSVSLKRKTWNLVECLLVNVLSHLLQSLLPGRQYFLSFNRIFKGS